MPVYKYKTFEEAEKALWNFNPDEKYFDKIAELWDFANKNREDIEIAYAKQLRLARRTGIIRDIE